MTLEQAIIVETDKAKEWREYNLPDVGDNIHEKYAEWFRELKCFREAWTNTKLALDIIRGEVINNKR